MTGLLSAAERWRGMVEEEHAQSDKARGHRKPPKDHWAPYATGFASDVRRTGDPMVERLAQEVSPSYTVLDVGAGGGRYSLPLALRCRHVLAVEPSASMASVLRQQASTYGIDNVSVVEATWEQAEVGMADVVICVHVLYTVRDIVSFLRKLEAHARKRVVVALYQEPPQFQVSALWERVHGEKRLRLPSLPELMEVLRELGIPAHQEALPAHPPYTFDTLQQALEQLAGRLFLEPDSPKQKLLEEMLDEFLEKANGAYRIRGAPDLVPNVVWWEPARP